MLVDIKIDPDADDEYAGKTFEGVISSVQINEDRGDDVQYYSDPANYWITIGADSQWKKVYSIPVSIIESVEVKPNVQ
jgi:hypothetical protein